MLLRDSSLSARRAWIEILCHAVSFSAGTVALRKESVDRNPVSGWRLTACLMVALRKESVDRNHAADMPERREASRSPQGERG